MAAVEVSKPRDISLVDDNRSESDDENESPDIGKPKIFDNMNFVEAPLPTINAWGVKVIAQEVCNNDHGEEIDNDLASMDEQPVGEFLYTWLKQSINYLFMIVSHAMFTPLHCQHTEAYKVVIFVLSNIMTLEWCPYGHLTTTALEINSTL